METNKSFIIRLIAFLMTALVLPCIYLAIRFNLFKSKMAISIWGIIIIGLILIVVSAMIKFYLAGMKTKWSYLKQILEGFIKVILPILFILVVVVWAKTKLQWLIENINLFISFPELHSKVERQAIRSVSCRWLFPRQSRVSAYPQPP